MQVSYASWQATSLSSPLQRECARPIRSKWYSSVTVPRTFRIMVYLDEIFRVGEDTSWDVEERITWETWAKSIFWLPKLTTFYPLLLTWVPPTPVMITGIFAGIFVLALSQLHTHHYWMFNTDNSLHQLWKAGCYKTGLSLCSLILCLKWWCMFSDLHVTANLWIFSNSMLTCGYILPVCLNR